MSEPKDIQMIREEASRFPPNVALTRDGQRIVRLLYHYEALTAQLDGASAEVERLMRKYKAAQDELDEQKRADSETIAHLNDLVEEARAELRPPTNEVKK